MLLEIPSSDFQGWGWEREQELVKWGKVAWLGENCARVDICVGTPQQIHDLPQHWLTALVFAFLQWSLACCAWGDTSSGETGNGRILKA